MEELSLSLAPYKEIVGSVASVVTILQFFSGSFLCYDIYKKHSTKGTTAVPFIGGVVIGILFLKYAILLDDKAMFNVNIAAVILNAIYVVFYFYYSHDTVKQIWKPCSKGVALTAVIVGYFTYEDPDKIEYRYGLCVTILMLLLLGSPLLELKEIIKNRDASSIPFPMTLSGTVVTFLWLIYGIILLNNFMIVQNVVGLILCVIQLTLSIIYPARTVRRNGKKSN